MKFRRENGGIISMVDPVETLLLSYRQMKTSDPESGGMILGRLIENNNDIVIDEITTPSPADWRTRFSFLRKRKDAQIKVNEAWSKTSGTCIYLGEWHTHPEDVPEPSQTIDLIEWSKISKTATFEQDFLFFLIVGRTHTKGWELTKASDEISHLKSLDNG